MTVPISDDLQYVRDRYGVPAEINGRIRYTWNGDKLGTIVGGDSRLLVLLDGEDEPAPFHPTWEIEYLACPTCGSSDPAVLRMTGCGFKCDDPSRWHAKQRALASRPNSEADR